MVFDKVLSAFFIAVTGLKVTGSRFRAINCSMDFTAYLKDH